MPLTSSANKPPARSLGDAIDHLLASLEETTCGQCWFFGDLVEKRSPGQSLIFQERALLPWLSVWQNVSFGLSIRCLGLAERKEIARQARQRLGLAEAFDKRPDALSVGMRQRAAVARALAMCPIVLLMDEPFAALDEQTGAGTQDFLGMCGRNRARRCCLSRIISTRLSLWPTASWSSPCVPAASRRSFPSNYHGRGTCFRPKPSRSGGKLTQSLRDEIDRNLRRKGSARTQ